MAGQIQKEKTSTQTEGKVEETKATDTTERDAHLKDIDDILNDIDGILEENAEEFVAAYVQKGGE